MKSYISDGLVSETVLLLDAIAKYKCTNIHEIMELRITYGINKRAALSFALQCRWAIQNHESINITAKGMIIVSQFDGCSLSQKLWRSILWDYVISSSPAWSKRIPSGRKEAYIFMTPDEKRCFMESGLMDKPVDNAIVQWWDTITKTIREVHQDSLNEIGRIGEQLTVEYERNRTRLEPEWESIESNVVGYDVLSSREETCLEPILIEVKTSTLDCTTASMIISQNEWSVASCSCNRDRYFFYLWLLGCEKQLARITVDEVEKHIPSNIGSGKWENAKVPFSCFADRFQVINTYDEMAKQLDTEKKQAQKRWAAQEKILQKVTSSLYGMSGDLQGIAGREIIALPALEGDEYEDEIKAVKPRSSNPAKQAGDDKDEY